MSKSKKDNNQPRKNANPAQLNTKDEQIIQAVKNSQSYSGALRYLGLVPAGANYKWIKKQIVRLELSTDHMTGRGWTKGLKIDNKSPNKIPLSDILVDDSTYLNTSRLKKRLIAAGMLDAKCLICGISKWEDKPLALHLDHINGKNSDNRIDNLRLLCPNCHSQTDTYAGRSLKKAPNQCMDCDAEISRAASRCTICSGKAIQGYSKEQRSKDAVTEEWFTHCINCYQPKRYRHGVKYCKACASMLSNKAKADWPELEDLQKMVSKSSYTEVGKKLGVSDNAVRHHIHSRLSLQARRNEFGYPGSEET